MSRPTFLFLEEIMHMTYCCRIFLSVFLSTTLFMIGCSPSEKTSDSYDESQAASPPRSEDKSSTPVISVPLEDKSPNSQISTPAEQAPPTPVIPHPPERISPVASLLSRSELEPSEPLISENLNDILNREVRCGYVDTPLQEVVLDLVKQVDTEITLLEKHPQISFNYDFEMDLDDIEAGSGDYRYGGAYGDESEYGDDEYEYDVENEDLYNPNEMLIISDIKITSLSERLPLRLFLDYLAVQYNICWEAEEESIELLHPALLPFQNKRKAYDVSELGDDAEAVCVTMRQLIDPLFWSRGENDESEFCHVVNAQEGATLAIMSHRSILERSDAYYAQCLAFFNTEMSDESFQDPHVDIDLDKRIAMDAEDLISLRDAVRRIEQELSANVIVSPAFQGRRTENGLANLRQVTGVELPLRTILRTLFGSEGITLIHPAHSHDSLWIVDGIQVCPWLIGMTNGNLYPTRFILGTTAIIDVTDLFEGTQESGVKDFALSLQSVIPRDSKLDSLTLGFSVGDRHGIFVQGTREHIQEIKNVLAILRAELNLVQSAGFATPETDETNKSGPGSRIVDVDYQDAPLRSVLEDLCRKADVPLILNHADIQRDLFPENWTVTLQQGEMTLRDALLSLQEGRGITCSIMSDYVYAADSRTTRVDAPLRLYETTDLVFDEKTSLRIVWSSPSQDASEFWSCGWIHRNDGLSGIPMIIYESLNGSQSNFLLENVFLVVKDRAFLIKRATESQHDIISRRLDVLRRRLAGEVIEEPDMPETDSLTDVPPLPTSDAISDDNFEQLVLNGNQFAFDFCRELAAESEDEKNVFFSPYGLSTLMGMAYAGTGGETADQIREALLFEGAPEIFWAKQIALQNEILGSISADLGSVDIANGIWIQQDYPIERDYLSIIKRGYGSEADNVDFTQPGDAAQRINLWAERSTQGRINRIVQPQDFNALTRIVLANSVFFKGRWASPFEETLTRPLPFHDFNGDEESIDMMCQEDYFSYGESDGSKFIILGYKDVPGRMLLVLPEDEGKEAFEALQKHLDAAMLDRWMESELSAETVSIRLPRFSLSADYILNDPLQALGVHDAFVFGDADFSAIDSSKQLFIEMIRQKATLDIDEKGTVAAAVTSMSYSLGGEPPEPKQFHADRPFLLFIQHHPSDAILFMGRVMKPEPLERATHP
jgi:serpin B